MIIYFLLCPINSHCSHHQVLLVLAAFVIGIECLENDSADKASDRALSDLPFGLDDILDEKIPIPRLPFPRLPSFPRLPFPRIPFPFSRIPFPRVPSPFSKIPFANKPHPDGGYGGDFNYKPYPSGDYMPAKKPFLPWKYHPAQGKPFLPGKPGGDPFLSGKPGGEKVKKLPPIHISLNIPPNIPKPNQSPLVDITETISNILLGGSGTGYGKGTELGAGQLAGLGLGNGVTSSKNVLQSNVEGSSEYDQMNDSGYNSGYEK